MRSLLCGCTAVLALTLSLAAQVPPALVKTTGQATSTPPVPQVIPRFAPLGPAALTTTSTGDISQIEMREISGSQYRVGYTSSSGAVSGLSIYEGVYDAMTESFTLRTVGGMPTTQNLANGNEFALTITHDGLLCVWDVNPGASGQVWWSRRDNDGDMWGAPWMAAGQPAGKQISLPKGVNLADSKIFTSDRDPVTGVALAAPKLYYTGISLNGAQDVLVAELVITGTSPNEQASLVNEQVLFSDAAFGSTGIHSQHPISDAAGNVFGWLMNSDQDDDLIYIPYINASQGWHVVYDDPDSARMNNGTSMGITGSWIMEHNQSSPAPDPFSVCTVAMNGDTWPAATGGRVDLRVMVPYSNTDTYFCQVWVGTPVPPFAIPAPPTIGHRLGFEGEARPPALLGVAPAILLPVLPAGPGTGGVTYSFRVPRITGALDLQPLAWNVATGQLYLGNTATMASK